MASTRIEVKIIIRHKWLIFAINYPRVLFGFDVWIPRICYRIEVLPCR